MLIDVKLEQPENALFPIVVTEFGISIDVKLEHPQNAHFPIEVIEFGILYSPS